MFNDPAIAGSWPNLVERLDRTGRPTAWATRATALAGLRSVGDLPAMVAEHVPPARADDVIGALVRLAATDGADDPDALLVLLHLLSGGVQALATKLAHLSDNILALVVGELTCRIRRYPWQRRTRAHARNLLLDLEQRRGYGTATRHRIADDLGINERTVRRRRPRTCVAPPGPSRISSRSCLMPQHRPVNARHKDGLRHRSFIGRRSTRRRSRSAGIRSRTGDHCRTRPVPSATKSSPWTETPGAPGPA